MGYGAAVELLFCRNAVLRFLLRQPARTGATVPRLRRKRWGCGGSDRRAAVQMQGNNAFRTHVSTSCRGGMSG